MTKQAKKAEEFNRNREERIEQLAQACRVKKEKIRRVNSEERKKLELNQNESMSSISFSCGFRQVSRLNLKTLPCRKG